MTAVLWATQEAVFDLLSGDVQLSGKVFDHVPPNRQPGDGYLVISEANTVPSDLEGLTYDAVVVEIAIHGWSKAEGTRSLKKLVDRTVELLADQDLEVEGWQHVMTRLVRAGIRAQTAEVQQAYAVFRVTVASL